jgi:hypothetical protein
LDAPQSAHHLVLTLNARRLPKNPKMVAAMIATAMLISNLASGTKQAAKSAAAPPAATAESLAAVGVAPEPLAESTLDVVRTGAKGKWHVPGDGLDRCQHLSRAYGYQPDGSRSGQ